MIAAALFLAAATTTATPRIEPPDTAYAAVREGRLADAEAVLLPVINKCLADHTDGEPCVDVAAMHMMVIALDGNAAREKTLLDAMGFVERAAGPDDSTTALAVRAVGMFYDRRQDVAKAMPWFKRGMDLALERYGPSAPQSVTAVVGYAMTLFASDRAGEAIPLIEPYANLPATTPAQKTLLAEVLSQLGNLYRAAGRPRDAEAPLRRALSLFNETSGERDPRAVSALGDLANLLHATGREAEARPLALRARSLAAPGSPVLQLTDWVVGGEGGSASGGREGELRSRLAELDRTRGANSAVALLAAADLGMHLIDTNRAAEAKPLLDRVAIGSRDGTLPPGVRANLMIPVSYAYLKIGQPASAAKQWEGAVALMRSVPNYNQGRLLTYEGMLGSFYTATGRPADGRAMLMSSSARLLSLLASYREFDAAAQVELRENSPVFRFHVQANWALAYP